MMLTLLNLSIIPIAAGIQAVGPWPMIIGGLFMVVIAGRVIRTAWRDFNRTFPRVYPGKPAAGDPLGQIGDYNRTFPRRYPGDWR
jgi:hypothetical protein